jgi:2-polyprenyl-3-methyl-5-hydroxy-6-metoxy-1,4-benzoquinol methylase
MSTTSTCLLCRGGTLRRVASVETSLVRREYQRVLGIDVHCEHPCLYLERCADCDLAFFVPQCPGDEDFYRALQEFPWYYQSDKPEYHAAAAHAAADDDVLEIGAGEGAFAAHLRCRSYRMLELNHAAVEVARGNGLDARDDSIEEHAISHPEAFDVVCAFQVLEHVPNPREFIESAVACLRPGGRLIVSVPADESFVGHERRGLLNLPPHHMTRWSDRCLTELAAVFGLDVVALHRDKLAPWHIRPYASNLADELLAGVLRRRWQPLDPLFVTGPMRVARAALLLGLDPLARARTTRVRGHSTTTVYRKP